MAGYRTVDELMDILEEECLEFDAVARIVGGNNKYDYQIITVPKKNVHIKKDGAYIDMQGLDQQIAGSLSGGNSGSGDVVDDFDFGMEDIDIDDSDKTIALGFFGVSEEIQPVTGWLVCTRGEEKGKDYRLHSGKNFIGRSAKMDVVLLKDNQIAREKHASIVYDPKGHGFYISPEEANLVYHNDQLLAKVQELKENDKIRVGETELVFVPYCKEERRWQEE